MNTLKTLGQFLINNLVAILFLLGLTLLNISIYLKFDYIIGLLATGVTLIVISLIYQFEKSQQPIK
ncbi:MULTISPECIES: hypothetical protein [Staphylococcus]|uniref:Uncharacterized protein n=1 Tax=Staphylococcus hominis TaxID=1290 RepID=A0A8X8GRE2_STAHO|nr:MULTISPECIES: hypothetical protein [Staphylococcus]OHO58426.1 hypothetical protein HMPREF2650_05465 [Staphylococcus sp. HMSC035F02]DAY85311.1 MAG TPA: Protein of unknown function (DUF1056) [Caudoviricetes sp.]MCM5673130.1 hypothetical protein [Staphylococcus hominis]MDO0983720.1 hypothetical protein [Staphylococcus hominis]MDS3898543.1 hypothetical protein [Staphylococcus hominis]